MYQIKTLLTNTECNKKEKRHTSKQKVLLIKNKRTTRYFHTTRIQICLLTKTSHSDISEVLLLKSLQFLSPKTYAYISNVISPLYDVRLLGIVRNLKSYFIFQITSKLLTWALCQNFKIDGLPLSTGTWRPKAPNSFSPSMTWSSTFSRLSFFRGSFIS